MRTDPRLLIDVRELRRRRPRGRLTLRGVIACAILVAALWIAVCAWAAIALWFHAGLGAP